MEEVFDKSETALDVIEASGEEVDPKYREAIRIGRDILKRSTNLTAVGRSHNVGSS